jgi:hypothetical protein
MLLLKIPAKEGITAEGRPARYSVPEIPYTFVRVFFLAFLK